MSASLTRDKANAPGANPRRSAATLTQKVGDDSMSLSAQARFRAALPADVYRVYDAHDALLYVGCSTDAYKRVGEHRRTSPWFPRMARFTVTRYRKREQALDVEALAILTEHPEFNVNAAAWRALLIENNPPEPIEFDDFVLAEVGVY